MGQHPDAETLDFVMLLLEGVREPDDECEFRRLAGLEGRMAGGTIGWNAPQLFRVRERETETGKRADEEKRVHPLSQLAIIQTHSESHHHQPDSHVDRLALQIKVYI